MVAAQRLTVDGLTGWPSWQSRTLNVFIWLLNRLIEALAHRNPKMDTSGVES